MFLESFNLGEQIDFGLDDFKNKVIVNKENGSRITVFALKKNQILPTHHSDLDVFVFVLDGKIEFRVSEKNHIVEKEEAFIIPATEPHSVKALKDSKFLVIRI